MIARAPGYDGVLCRHGEGVLPVPSTAATWQGTPAQWNTHCPDCDGGAVKHEGIDWIEAPANACVWEAS